MIISVVLIHDRIVLSEEQHVATHWISKSLERGEISNVVMIGFEKCGHTVLAHQRLRTIHALSSHALRIEALLPIGHFRTKSELRRILDHKRASDRTDFGGSTLPGTKYRFNHCLLLDQAHQRHKYDGTADVIK